MMLTTRRSLDSCARPGVTLVRFDEVCSIHPGQHILEVDYNRRGVGWPYLTGPADFGRDAPNISRWTEKPKTWCEPGDVLVTVKGAGVGKVNLAPAERTAIGRQLMAIRPRVDRLSQLYLYFPVAKTRGFRAGKALQGVLNAAKRRDGLEATGGAVQQFQKNHRKKKGMA